MSGVARVGEENGIHSFFVHHLFSLFFPLPIRNVEVEAVSFTAGLIRTLFLSLLIAGRPTSTLWLSVE